MNTTTSKNTTNSTNSPLPGHPFRTSKRIIVTGGAGFIGSHVVDACVDAGHEVLVIDNLSTGSAQNVNPAARLEQIDIRDTQGVAKVFASFRPQVVNHHAAQIDIRRSVDDPIFDAEVNVIGSVNLMQQAVRNHAKGFIFASSGGAIYGETPHPAAETAAKAPISPYGAAKAAVENYLFAYRETFGLGSVVLRYANVYGPRQDPSGEAGVVSIFASALIAGHGVTIFGSGEQVRDYVFVMDVARANLLALDLLFNEAQAPGNPDESAFNIASGRATSVNALYDEMVKIIPARIEAVHADARPGELMESRLAITRARDGLGFLPQVKLPDGLLQTVDWQKNVKETSSKRVS